MFLFVFLFLRNQTERNHKWDFRENHSHFRCFCFKSSSGFLIFAANLSFMCSGEAEVVAWSFGFGFREQTDSLLIITVLPGPVRPTSSIACKGLFKSLFSQPFFGLFFTSHYSMMTRWFWFATLATLVITGVTS